MKRENKGFSLVEIIIVIAIMAVLLAVLTPLYLTYVEKAKNTTAMTDADNVMQATITYYSDKYESTSKFGGYSHDDDAAILKLAGADDDVSIIEAEIQNDRFVSFIVKDGDRYAIYKDGKWSVSKELDED